MTDTTKPQTDRAEPMNELAGWLRERRDNARHIADLRQGTDRNGWLEDAAYFDWAVKIVEASRRESEVRASSGKADGLPQLVMCPACFAECDPRQRPAAQAASAECISVEMMEEAARKVGFDPIPGRLILLAGVLNGMLAATPTGERPAAPAQAAVTDALRIADALERAAGINGSYHQQADWQRYTQREGARLLRLLAQASPAQPSGVDAMPTSWELSFGSDDEEEPGKWRVHRRHGSINDREWTLLAEAETPSAAIAKALRPDLSTALTGAAKETK
jgi:hypothetical protein